MKKTDLNTSKILLIILGVLVAIIIGFNSRAIGSSSFGLDLNSKVDQTEQKVGKSTFKDPGKIALLVVDWIKTEL